MSAGIYVVKLYGVGGALLYQSFLTERMSMQYILEQGGTIAVAGLEILWQPKKETSAT